VSRLAQHTPSRHDQEPLPSYVCGRSRYYYDQGCRCLLCKAKAAACQASARAKRRTHRDPVDGRWVSHLLAPVDSDKPARHGTVYGRSSYGCECGDCKDATTPRLPKLPARLANLEME